MYQIKSIKTIIEIPKGARRTKEGDKKFRQKVKASKISSFNTIEIEYVNVNEVALNQERIYKATYTKNITSILKNIGIKNMSSSGHGVILREKALVIYYALLELERLQQKLKNQGLGYNPKQQDFWVQKTSNEDIIKVISIKGKEILSFDLSEYQRWIRLWRGGNMCVGNNTGNYEVIFSCLSLLSSLKETTNQNILATAAQSKKETLADEIRQLEIRKSQLEKETLDKNITQLEVFNYDKKYDRTTFDEVVNQYKNIDKEKENINYEKREIGLSKLALEAKENNSSAQLERRLQQAEYIEQNVKNELNLAQAKMIQNEIEKIIFKEQAEREYHVKMIDVSKQLLNVEKREMLIQFDTMQNTLKEAKLDMKDYFMQRNYELQLKDIELKNQLVQMGEMMNLVDTKNLEQEKKNMAVMEKVAQTALLLKEHETRVEKLVLNADRLKLEAERQGVINLHDRNQVELTEQKFNIEYGKARNELGEMLLNVKTGELKNKSEEAMLGLDKRAFQAQALLESVNLEKGFVNLGMEKIEFEKSIFGREKTLALGEVNVAKTQVMSQFAVEAIKAEKTASDIANLQKMGRLEDTIQLQKIKLERQEQDSDEKANRLQGDLQQAGIENSHLRYTNQYLRSGK